MRIGIVGGLLQGIEAVYLSKKAGYETLVIDKKCSAPAAFISDDFEEMDITENISKTKKILSDCDAVIPANENLDTLIYLDKLMEDIDTEFLFDLNAYKISSSKILSNRLMEHCNVPMPKPWPECGYPAVVKPSSQSGSIGVKKVFNSDQMKKAVEDIRIMEDEVIIQEFADGPNISIEVIGNGSYAEPMIVTEVILDRNYDCKMVQCPASGLSNDDIESLCTYGKNLAESLSLKGIMDLEAINSVNGLKLLEIDARIPSQTPAAVLNATGVNLIKCLAEGINGNIPKPSPKEGAALYEHIFYDNGTLSTCGEKVFSKVEKPRIETGLFGASEIITDYESRKNRWYATVINVGKTPEEAWSKRQKCIERIIEENHIEKYVDPVPEMVTLPA